MQSHQTFQLTRLVCYDLMDTIQKFLVTVIAWEPRDLKASMVISATSPVPITEPTVFHFPKNSSCQFAQNIT